jgi:hypothetical protein
MSEKISIVTILHGEKDFIPLIKHNYNLLSNPENHKNYLQELELIIIDDGKENLIEYFTDLENCIYIHLTKDDVSKFMDQIDENYKQPNKLGLQYQRKCSTLPNGFKRDYGCGMTTHDLILHMNMDCVYNKKTIERKINFMKRTNAECIYCDTTLAYDIYGKELYKTISPVKIFESTLFHTKEFWKRKGFLWHDIDYEGKQFHYNNGIDRKMDNFYDTVQLLGIHNLNQYNPVKITLENMKIDIPDLISEINISEHPFVKYIDSMFDKDVNILGISSEFLDNIKNEDWNVNNIKEKWKQSKLSNMIKEINTEFNVLLYGDKNPAWSLFNNISFDVIFLETNKNYDQMSHIILNCKKHEFVNIKGIFIRKSFLES